MPIQYQLQVRKRKWLGLPNAKVGTKKKASKLVKSIKRSYREAGLKNRFRIVKRIVPKEVTYHRK